MEINKSNQIKEGLRIHYLGREACEPNHSFGPATRAHYLIHFILKGKGRYETNNEKFNVSAGEAFLINPSELTFYQSDKDNPWEYIWIAFDGREAEIILHNYGLQSNYICKSKDLSQTTEFLERLCEAYGKHDHSKEELIGWFYLFFSSIQKELPHEEQSEVCYYDMAETYIRHNYGYHIHVHDIADYIGIDRTYLYRIFMKYKNTSPKQYLTECRIHAAKDMLRNTTLTVTEVALSCGFHDSSVFCKNFTKGTGMTPLHYRNSKSFN